MTYINYQCLTLSHFFVYTFVVMSGVCGCYSFVIKIKHISTEFVKDLLLKCAYFT